MNENEPSPVGEGGRRESLPDEEAIGALKYLIHRFAVPLPPLGKAFSFWFILRNRNMRFQDVHLPLQAECRNLRP